MDVYGFDRQEFLLLNKDVLGRVSKNRFPLLKTVLSFCNPPIKFAANSSIFLTPKLSGIKAGHKQTLIIPMKNFTKRSFPA